MTHVAADYHWSSGDSLPSHGYIVPFVLSWLRRSAARRVADIGAGNGFLCGEMVKAGYEVVGVEYDAGGVAIAKQAHPHIPFYRMGVEDDPQRLLAHEAPFDAVISTEVIEHLYAPQHLPRFAAEVLKPGGQLLVTTPFHGYLKNLALATTGKMDAHFCALWHGGHIKFWSRKTLTQLLSHEGFEVTRFDGLGRVPYLWKSMALTARRR